MKFLTLLSIVALTLPACSRHSAKSIAVPDAVVKTFTQNNPDAGKVKWEKEGENYNAEFKVKDVEKEISCDALGNLISTETKMKTENLLSNIREYITSNYQGYEIEEADLLETKDGIFYKVEIEKGKEEIDLIFDKSGNFVKTEIEDENDD